jgi:hypothetical protein
MIVLGVLLLVAAGAVAVNGIVANSGSQHVLAHQFSVFGYAVQGSAGRVFFYGIVVGVVGILGLALLFKGLSRGVRNRAAARRELKRTRQEREALRKQKEQLATELDSERARTAAAPASPAPASVEPERVDPAPAEPVTRPAPVREGNEVTH